MYITDSTEVLKIFILSLTLGRKLPENIIAIPDIVTAAKDADFMIIVLPHQFIARSLQPLKGQLKPGVSCISLGM